ncbi:hypothetical protein BV898_19672 [Hypsibius exemplaris]|uniref:Uncharacterized protein n=1 Tax=Hypsibius exemplaris TaxID=2072580 RepID=A0A9X6NLC0_HYPEX|nr:hypothetical protein BV898_19672 [Hypsibius exemplaris]
MLTQEDGVHAAQVFSTSRPMDLVDSVGDTRDFRYRYQPAHQAHTITPHRELGSCVPLLLRVFPSADDPEIDTL